MSISNLPLMKAIGAKINYLDARQGILAQNIANADTPGYQSRDLTEVDFGSVLNNLVHSNKVKLESTNPLHLPNANEVERSKNNKDKLTYEVAPDKNGVIVEEQMVKASQVQLDYNMLVNLASKQTSMYKTAIGRNS